MMYAFCFHANVDKSANSMLLHGAGLTLSYSFEG